MTPELFRWLGWGLSGAGVLLLVWAMLMAKKHARQAQGWLRAEGKVVARETRQLTPGNPYHFPVIEFTAADGSPQRFEVPTGRWVHPDEIGDSVAVLYDPAQPAQAIVARFSDCWVVPAFTAGFGGLALLLGALLIGLARE